VTHTVEIQVSDETLAALQCDPRSYAAELRVAAAAKLYEVGRVPAQKQNRRRYRRLENGGGGN